jgi:hypothetical protein
MRERNQKTECETVKKAKKRFLLFLFRFLCAALIHTSMRAITVIRLEQTKAQRR